MECECSIFGASPGKPWVERMRCDGIFCGRGLLVSILVLSMGPKVSCGGRSSIGAGLANAIEERGGRKGGIDGYSLYTASRGERGWDDMYDQLITFRQNTGEERMATMAAKTCFFHAHSERFENITHPSFELQCTHTFLPCWCRTIVTGHCRVQQIRGEDGSIRDRGVWKLGMWLAKQRRLMRRGMLEEDKIALLKGMGISSRSAQGNSKAAACGGMAAEPNRANSRLGATGEGGGKGVGDAKQQERDEEEKLKQEVAGRCGRVVHGSATTAGIGKGKICKRGEGEGRKKGASVAFGVLWERWLDLLREFSMLPSLPSAHRCTIRQ
jgi:hypothetical protein